MAWSGSAVAQDIVCRGTLFGDTDFIAYHGEVGFGRIVLNYRQGGSVEVPLLFVTKRQDEEIFRGNNPNQPGDVVEIFAPTPVRDGTRIRVSYNGNLTTGNCSSTGASPSSPGPTSGNFSGRGRATGSVFRRGESADASLNFNQGNFNLSLAVPPGNRAQVTYQGTFDQVNPSDSGNSNSFFLDGQVRTFASSANNLRVMNTSGRCRIEVFDDRVTSVNCSTSLANSATQFTGMQQF
ncbi:MAG: hypothetical protein HC890_19245 [Chloroflexaceae bacterium]|nr:hypothetical protein [Chloroflexaceae bacterium]